MSLSILGRARRCALLLGVIGAVAPAGAHAACYSSTPSSTAFADSPIDGDLAPDIGTVSLALSATCTYSVDPGIASTLIDGDAVFAYIDTDGNPATGSPTFNGADVAVGSLGVTGPDPAPLKGVWDPAQSSFSFAGAPSLTPVGVGGFAASLDQLGVPGPTTTNVRVGSIWEGIYYDYFDWAPAPPAAPIALPVAFSTTPPPPPPPPAPTPTPAPVAAPAPAPTLPSPVAASGTTACKVPAVGRLRTTVAWSAVRHAGCKVGLVERAYSSSVPAGRVIRSMPKAGTRWAEPVDLLVSRGRKPKHKARAHRAQTLDVRALVEIASRRADALAR